MNAIAAALTHGGLDLQPFQRRFLRGAFAPGVTVGALCAARGSGETELIGRIGAQVVIPGSPLFRPEHEAVVFAGSMRQAKAVYKAARRAVCSGRTGRSARSSRANGRRPGAIRSCRHPTRRSG